MAGLTLDSGALIAVERDYRAIQAVARLADPAERTVPSIVLAQAWRGPTSVRIAMLVNSCRIEALDEFLAKAAGELLARAGTSDVADAIVVASAARRGDIILTSDAGDLRHLAGFARGSVRIMEI